MDRLSRKLVHQLIIEEELRQAGVSVNYVLGGYEDTDEDKLLKQIRGAIAEYERAKIIERSRRGRRAKARSGQVVVHRAPPYGYRPTVEDGKAVLVVHEPEAAIVRRIFKWFIWGEEPGKPLPVRTIADKLTAMGIPKPRSNGNRQWAHSTVRNILTNEVYIGRWYYNRQRCDEGRRTRQPREEWILVEVPPIVSEEVFKAAQNRLRRNKKLSLIHI